jgi:hypothetical protein
VAGVVAALIAWLTCQFWEQEIGHATIALKIGAVFVPAGIAGAAYLAIAFGARIPAAKEIMDFALAKFRGKRSANS